MKYCPNCAAANADASRFCGECGVAVGAAAPIRTRHMPSDSLARSRPVVEAPTLVAAPVEDRPDPTRLLRALTERTDGRPATRSADIMFVLDCTGSMRGEIDAIKDAITDFADTIKSDGVRVRVGLVAFRDRLFGEEHRALTFAGVPFTADPLAFRREVSGLSASGGGDAPESSLDAVMLALQQPFATDANKVIVLVTDAPPHIPDQDTRSIEEVVTRCREVGVKQMYLVIRAQDQASHVYLKLLEGVRGLAFDLGHNDDFKGRAADFTRTLMRLGKTISSMTT